MTEAIAASFLLPLVCGFAMNFLSIGGYCSLFIFLSIRINSIIEFEIIAFSSLIFGLVEDTFIL